MESHSSIRVHNPEHTPDASKKISPRVELSPEVRALYEFAVKKYGAYMKDAQKIDDAQPHFTSKLENFLKASNMTTHASLKALQDNAR